MYNQSFCFKYQACGKVLWFVFFFFNFFSDAFLGLTIKASQ